MRIFRRARFVGGLYQSLIHRTSVYLTHSNRVIFGFNPSQITVYPILQFLIVTPVVFSTQTISDPIQDAWWDGVTDIAYTSTTNLQSDYGSQVSAHVRSIYGTTTHVAGMGTGLPAAYELHPVAHGILVALAPNSDGNLRLWVFQ